MLINVGNISVNKMMRAALILAVGSSSLIGAQHEGSKTPLDIDYNEDLILYKDLKLPGYEEIKIVDNKYIEDVAIAAKEEERFLRYEKIVLEREEIAEERRLAKEAKEAKEAEEAKKAVKIASSSKEADVKSEPSLLSNHAIKAFPHNTFKSYMRWTILSSSSPQGKLAAKAVADPSTAIMKYNGRYLVALGFAYAGNIGEHIDIVMESGQVIPAIVGDWKAKEHTDANNSASLNNGSIIEFIVASNEAANKAVNGSGNYNTIFPGNVKEFRK